MQKMLNINVNIFILFCHCVVKYEFFNSENCLHSCMILFRAIPELGGGGGAGVGGGGEHTPTYHCGCNAGKNNCIKWDLNVMVHMAVPLSSQCLYIYFFLFDSNKDWFKT